MKIIESSSAAARLDAAMQFLAGRPPAAQVVVVGASRGAADDFVRTVARQHAATFGLIRFSLTELAARAASTGSAGARRAPGTQAGAEAVAARAVFDAVAAGELAYFEPVASMPGFPKALARTVYELRLAGIAPERLTTMRDGPDDSRSEVRLKPALSARPSPRSERAVEGPDATYGAEAGADIGRLLARVEEQFDRAAVDDRAALFRLAAAACRARRAPWTGLPLLLLDVPLDSRVERDFVAALIESSPDVLATIPDGDRSARDALTSLGGPVERIEEAGGSDLGTLRRYIFTIDRPPERDQTGDVSLFSAPGEGREAVEIVRRVLDEASRGVPFDEMAVFLRAPQHYLGLLEHACARGGVPVYFDRGTRRPDPAGRAFLALLSCAAEDLSAKRFDEYLSLGQVPEIRDRDRATPLTRPRDEAYPRAEVALEFTQPIVRLEPALSARPSTPARPTRGQAGSGPAVEGTDATYEGDGDGDGGGDRESDDETPDSDDEAVVAGTLRSPWKWEELIVESAVVGGRSRADGKARWRRRLDGLAADFRYRIAELTKEEPESPRIARFARDLRNLAHLRQFALPIVDELADWPERATWGEWLDRFSSLATRAIRQPVRVLETLADLRPMAGVGPVTVEEARQVLHDRLAALDWNPRPRRYGRLFVGTPHQARGRRFRVVFVPGLAERVVPQRPREDPLLLDERRRPLDPALMGQEERGTVERLLLKIAIGAASERLYLSYPRLDVAETRARVPSFYALDVARAITGRVPDHRVLAADAAGEGGASLAWPAPNDPDRAIDDLEHDLAVLKPLLDARDAPAVKGRAHYMLGLNEALHRSVISRWERAHKAWKPGDGLIKVAPGTEAALASHRLNRRPYSLSALQRFGLCPYQFLLATIYRLEPWDEPEPIVRMDPLTRGSLYHKAQADFFRAMEAAGALPVLLARLPDAIATLNTVLDRVAAEYAESLAPAIERVWRDEIDELRRDLGIWVRKLADGSAWLPAYFEFSFGLGASGQSEIAEGRDARSLPDPIIVGDRFVLRGSVDLIEHRADLDVLRVTDHKTGKNRSTPDLIVGGGSTLQPVLYSLAIERGLGKRVVAGRLFYSTTAGGFVEHEIPINEYTRGQGLEVLAIIDRAVERGFLPAAPAERACTWCDFRPVCGPREEERTATKAPDKLADLAALRAMR